jgi:ubiquinone/menaquinone biosynthesis C-methylase UbiE
VDAACDQPEEAKSGELVSRVSTPQQTGRSGTEVFAAPVDEVACVSVHDGYERWAQSYDHSPNPILALEERYLSSLLPDLAGKHALDLACGTGRWLTRLWARGARAVVGLDLSIAMLLVAREKFSVRNRLVRADLLQLPFRESTFDFVLSSFALNHIHSLEAMAHELAQTMRSNGHLVISEMHPEAYARGWRPGFRDTKSAVQIETTDHSTEDVISSFRSNRLLCQKIDACFFGEPERPIFLGSGKAEIFTGACRVPAIQVYQFMKTDGALGS